jgi:hypothetical protein
MQHYSTNYTNALEPRKNDIENNESPSNQLIDILETRRNIFSNILSDFNIDDNNIFPFNYEISEFSYNPFLNNSDNADINNNNLLTEYNFNLQNNSDAPHTEIGNVQVNNIQQILPEPESQVKEEKKTFEKKRGRKNKDDESERNHDKNKLDNMSVKSKTYFKKYLLTFINSKIKPKDFSFVINDKLYSGDEVKLLNITDENIRNTNVDYNIELFNTKIGNILSDKISGRYKKYPENYNQEIINNIYGSKKGDDLKKIFDKTFLECLKYYRMDEDIYGKDVYACLSGLEKGFQELPNKLLEDNKNDQQYVENLIELIKKFEEYYSSKTARNRGKKGKQKI